jgi:hypothetical protein
VGFCRSIVQDGTQSRTERYASDKAYKLVFGYNITTKIFQSNYEFLEQTGLMTLATQLPKG